MKNSAPVNSWRGFKVGDLVTTYHKGYWRLTKITPRFFESSDIRLRVDIKVGEEGSALFEYEQVLTADMKPPRTKKPVSYVCDASSCAKITLESIQRMQQDFKDGVDRLMAVAGLNNPSRGLQLAEDPDFRPIEDFIPADEREEWEQRLKELRHKDG